MAFFRGNEYNGTPFMGVFRFRRGVGRRTVHAEV